MDKFAASLENFRDHIFTTICVLKNCIEDHPYAAKGRRAASASASAPSTMSEKGKMTAESGKVELKDVDNASLNFEISGSSGTHLVMVSIDEKKPWVRVKQSTESGTGTILTPANKGSVKGTYLEWAVFHALEAARIEMGIANKKSFSEAKKLAKLIELGSVLLIGPTGCGKTHNLNAAVMKYMPGWLLISLPSGSEGLQDIDLLGSNRPVPGQAGVFEFVPGPLNSAFEYASRGVKVVFFIDEVNRLNTKAANVLVGAMSLQEGGFTLFNYMNQTTLKVPASNLRFVSAINIGSGYRGTNAVDIALMRRYESVRFLDYMESGKEVRVISDATGVHPKLASKLVQVATSVRQAYREMNAVAPLDTGSLIGWGRLLADEDGMDEDCDYNFETILETAKDSWVYKCTRFDPTGYPQVESVEAMTTLIKAVFPEN